MGLSRVGTGWVLAWVPLLAVGGCSRSLEVNVPASYHGHVAIVCEQLSGSPKPIRVEADGEAKRAMCPRAKTSLVVLRDGVAVQPAPVPKWVLTGDGILLSIEFDAP